MGLYTRCVPVPIRNKLLQRSSDSLITVLNYHRVDSDPSDVNAVSVDNFERQMAYLDSHYQVITVADLLETVTQGSNQSRKVVITFDDGYRDNFENAAPILQKYNLPACFFIASGIVGTDKSFRHDRRRLGRAVPVMSWDHVRQLHDMGFAVGAHTVNHARLKFCDPVTLHHEIHGSKKMIEDKLGTEVSYFSHPYGLQEDISPNSLAEIKNAGFVCNFSAYGGLVQPAFDDTFALKRVGIPNHKSTLFFQAWVEGWRTQIESRRKK